MGYRLNRLDEPVFMAVSKPLLTEFGIHYRLESCGGLEISILLLVNMWPLNINLRLIDLKRHLLRIPAANIKE